MKIALLSDGIHPYVIGGMQRHSYFLTKYFAKNNIDVDLYHTWLNRERDIHQLDVFTEDEKKRIRSFVIDFPKFNSLPGHYLRESYTYSEKIFEQFKKNADVDFIYVKGFSGWKLLKEKEHGMKLPPVGIKFHGMNMFQKAPSFRAKLEQYMLRPPVIYNMKNADYVFSYGGKITDIIVLAGIPKKKIIEMPTGIETHWINENTITSGGKRKFIFVGRYERLKGLEELQKVLLELMPKFDFEFHFIGLIPEKLKIKSDKIKYWGQITDTNKIKYIMSQCDVLVCPSHSEGMPNVIIEAMAQGLAIIATNVGAVSEMVSEKNGWLIEPTQEKIIQALENAILILPEELNKMKNNSIEIIKEKFLWKNIAPRLIEKINFTIQKSS